MLRNKQSSKKKYGFTFLRCDLNPFQDSKFSNHPIPRFVNINAITGEEGRNIVSMKMETLFFVH